VQIVDNAQDIVERIIKNRRIPGAVFGLLEGDAVTTLVATGTANLNTGLPVVRDTLFQAGSIGKSYTATAVMQLVDDGSVDLDEPLRGYITDLEFADAEVSKTLTARQILTHVAGIDGDRLDDEMAFGRGDDCVARYVASLGDLPLITEPGGLWSYCNSGYIVLARLIEVVTGMTFEQALTTRLLAPLGLTDTLFFPGDMVTHSLAVGHLVEGVPEPTVAPGWEMSRAAGGAGSTINTTIDDLLAFAAMHLRDGVGLNGERVLSEASARAMRQPFTECPEPELLGDHWGLGFMIRSLAGPTVLGHDGNTHGQTSCLRIIPEKGVAWALLMNASGQNWAGMEVGQALVDPAYGTVTPGKPAPVDRPIGNHDRYVGRYESVGATLTVTSDDDSLTLTVAGREASPAELAMKGVLLPVTDERFVLRMPELGDDLPITFMRPTPSYDYIHMGARLYRRVS
jgi:CubicO group peptidase (beta-lactamase class C family)